MHVRQSLWPTNRLFYFSVKAAVTTSEQTGVPVFQENSAQMTRSHTLPMGRSLLTLESDLHATWLSAASPGYLPLAEKTGGQLLKCVR